MSIPPPVEMVSAATLTLDDRSLNSRARLDLMHVTKLVRALKANAELPATLVCRRTRRVVDGEATLLARVRIAGSDDAAVPVEWRTFANDGAAYLESCRRNSSHGKPLVHFDETTALVRGMRDFHLSMAAVARALSVTRNRASELLNARTGIVRVKGRNVREALKGTIDHMANRVLTAAQAEANTKLGGMSIAYYANQVSIVIEADLVPDDEVTLNALYRLRDLLNNNI